MGLSLPVANNPHWPYGGIDFGVLTRRQIDAIPGSVYLDHQEPSGAVLGAYNSALTLGRDVVINGDFASDTVWTKGAGWSIGGGNATHAAGSVELLSQDGIAAAGKTWQLTYTISNRTVGSVTAKLGASYAARSTNDTFVETITATSADLDFLPSNDFDGNIDDVILQQTNILASSAYPGAEELTDGDMEAATTAAWTTVDTISKETGTRTGGSGVKVLRIARNINNNPNAKQTVLTIGKRYRATGWARSDGNATPRLLALAVFWTGTTSTSWQSFDVEFIATNTGVFLQSLTATGTEYTEWDDVSITEVNPLNGDHTGVTVGQAATAALGLAVLDDGATSYSNIHSAEINSVFNPDAGTLMILAKVKDAGVWTDNTLRDIVRLRADGDNEIFIHKQQAVNSINFQMDAGGTTKAVASVALAGTTDYFILAMTWDTGANQLKAFINGIQVGSTQTGLGVWVGNLLDTNTVIGAASTIPGQVWDGFRTHVKLLRGVLPPAQILSDAKAAGVA